MPIESGQTRKNTAGGGASAVQGRTPRRALSWTERAWRPAATAVMVALTLPLGWHIVNGKNGLSVWMEKRAEERQLRREIDDLNAENARRRDRIEQLKNDPDAIGIVARGQLHYVKSNEVIVPVSPQPQSQAEPAGAGKQAGRVD
jgi:cell division protein FtsB